MSSESRTSSSFWRLFVSLSRGLAAFIAVYSLLSLAAAFFGDAYNQNAWWISFDFLPEPLSAVVQIALTFALGFFAVHVPKHIATRIVVALPVAVCLVAAISNTFDVYAAAAAGTIILGFPVAFSIFVGIGLVCIILSIFFGYQDKKASRAKTGLTMAAAVVITLVLFPVGQMHCFGTTNYRVPVDAAVVLGAQVYPDGTPSPVLQDRLDTAIQFYNDGYTSVLVLSGGIDVDGTSEAKVMQEYVVAQGIPVEDTLIDEQGSNTKQTARNTVTALQEAGLTKVATVSNFYHLARIKMLYLSEGMDVVTVPSEAIKDPGYPLLNVMREIPAWWYYWLLNLVE